MTILDPAVLRALETGVGLRLNLGCGQRPRPGFHGVDRLELPGVAIVADLNMPLSALPDDSVAEIYTRHTLEHVTDFLPLMKELYRITRADGRIEIVVPHFSNPYAYSDPTHVRFFGYYTFFYFADEVDQPTRKVPSFYLPERFSVTAVQVKLLKRSKLGKLLLSPLNWLINTRPAHQDWYERCLCHWLPAESIRYILRPKKPSSGNSQPDRVAERHCCLPTPQT